MKQPNSISVKTTSAPRKRTLVSAKPLSAPSMAEMATAGTTSSTEFQK